MIDASTTRTEASPRGVWRRNILPLATGILTKPLSPPPPPGTPSSVYPLPPLRAVGAKGWEEQSDIDLQSRESRAPSPGFYSPRECGKVKLLRLH